MITNGTQSSPNWEIVGEQLSDEALDELAALLLDYTEQGYLRDQDSNSSVTSQNELEGK